MRRLPGREPSGPQSAQGGPTSRLPIQPLPAPASMPTRRFNFAETEALKDQAEIKQGSWPSRQFYDGLRPFPTPHPS